MAQQDMYSHLAGLYDKLYSYKNYSKEVEFINQFVPDSTSEKNVLDLACGTGKHLGEYVKLDYRATGLDANEAMLTIAKKNFPAVNFVLGDLSNLDITDEYILISCLFSSIQYVTEFKALELTFATIYKHLKNGGVFAFDLGYAKDRWQEGYTVISTYRDDQTQIAMMAQSRSSDGISFWKPVIFSKINEKVNMVVDEHEIRLYSVEEIHNLLEDAGFSVSIYNNFSDELYTVGQSKGVPLFIAKKS